jgi:hypothetical protein
MVTLILPTQGNPIALKRTLDSVQDICDEIVIGSVCIFEDDIAVINSYKKEYNIKVLNLPFNYILKNGFSATLNLLADAATNDIVLYLNVGEVIDKNAENILNIISPEYNAYYIDHQTERHRWFRCYNRYEMRWQGIIHEEIDGECRPYHKPLFRFADTEKDTDNPFKSKVYNTVKEIVYWSLLIQIADNPDKYPETNDGWKQFAKDTYQSMVDRLKIKGDSYTAMVEGDLQKFLNYIHTDKEFEAERFESNHAIEFQGDPMYLGKK